VLAMWDRLSVVEEYNS